MFRELLSDVIYRVRALLRRGAVERELDDELRFHIEREADELERRGLSRAEAMRKAGLDFGGLEPMKEATRDARGTRLVESMMQDVRYALRVLRREPGFSVAVILILGLGIGANVSTFTVMNALLLRSLPVPHPEQLVAIGDPDAVESNWMGSPEHGIVSYPVYQDVRDRNRVLSGVYASGKLDDPSVMLRDSGGAVEHPQFRAVTGNFFDVLRVPAFIGRAITPDDDRAGAGQPVIVISHGYWQRRFGGERDAVGREILANGVALTIVGVTPAGFTGDVVGRDIDGWVPMAIEPLIQPRANRLDDRSWSWLQMMGRLAPGVALARARNELSAIEAESIRSHTTGDELVAFESDLKQVPIRVESGRTGFSRYRGAYAPALAVLMAAVALIVLIVSANVANLMLVRGVARAREMTVRMTLGAGRGRLVRQLLTESTLLAAAGGLLGFYVAGIGSRVLLAIAGTRSTPIPLDVSRDLPVLLFTGGVTILAALLFGIVPAMRATRVDVATTLRAQGRSVLGARTRSGGYSAGKALVVVQIALSVVLLIGAGLLVRSMQRIFSADLGFDRDHLIIAKISPQRSGYDGARSFVLMRELTDRIRALPTVTGVSATKFGFYTGGQGSLWLNVPGFTPASLDDLDVGDDLVGQGFFKTVGAQVIAGRDFDARDSETGARVAIINQTMARAYFKGVDPIGRTITERENPRNPPITIVGIVSDIRDRNVRQDPSRRVYFPIVQRPPSQFSLAVRTAGDPAGLVPAVREALLGRDRNLAFEVRVLDDLVRDSVAEDRLTMRVTGFFGCVALLLAALGLYGVTSYVTSQRTSEFGLRMALGAEPWSVVRTILGEGAKVALVGLAAGIPVGLLATILIRRQLFEVSPIDPLSLSVAIGMLAGMVLLASYIPARRAAGIAPVEALRAE